MKPTPICVASLTTTIILLGQGCLLAKPDAPQLTVKPLALTLSRKAPKPKRENMFNPFQGGSSGGIKISASATSRSPIKGKLVPGESKLISFKDDLGTDLESHEKEGKSVGMFGQTFQGLSASSQGGDGTLELEINSSRTPAPGSTHLAAEGLLYFMPNDAVGHLSHAAVTLEEDKVLKIGAAKVKFTKGSNRFGRPGGPGGDNLWYVQIVPGPSMINPTLLLFGADEDIPVLNTANQSNMMTSVMDSGRKNPFDGVVARGFSCPGGELSRIKIRFGNRESLIEVPFEMKIGLGDFTTPRPMN